MPIHSAHRPRRRESFPAPASPALYRNIAYTFVGITVLIVVAALWFSSVKAVVVVKAVREPVKVDVSVDVAQDPKQGQLPGRVVQGVFEKIQEFPVGTGGTAVDSIATGKVRITNNFSKAQPLVKTTRLLTADGRLYRIDDTVNVPAGGTVDVAAYADSAGAQFEFTEKTRFTIPGLAQSLQAHITAESIAPFKGGTRMIKAVSQADIDAGTKQLQEAVLAQAKQTLYAEVADGRFTESAYLVKTVEPAKTSVQVGQQADTFLLSLKLDVTGVFYSADDMSALVKERVNQRVPEGRDVVSYEQDKTTFTVATADAKDEEATVAVSASVQTKFSASDPDFPLEDILGLPIDEAESKLKQSEGIQEATITVKPSWVRRLPTQKDHVTIRVE
jgi:hypothetical protein